MISSLQDMQDQAKRLLAENAQLLLTAGGVVGTVGTGVLAWRGGYKAGRLSHAEETTRLESNREIMEADDDTPVLQPPTFIEKVGAYGIHAVPPVLAGSATVASIIMGHRMSASKAAALAAAYGLSQKQFEEYREKVATRLTNPKQEQIKTELAQDRVNETGGGSQIVVVEGKVLCFDEPTGRYFESTMEDLKKAEIKTNQEILHHDVASATFFYEELGLPPTTWSEEMGWNSDNLVELEFSTVLAYNDRPCISINFKNMPRPEYFRKY